MKAEELAVIKERACKANGESWLYNRHNEILTGRGARLAQVVCGTDAEFIAHAREDVPKLVAEVERLRSVIWRISDYCDMSIDETNAYVNGEEESE